jgi:hypothetical protein
MRLLKWDSSLFNGILKLDDGNEVQISKFQNFKMSKCPW